LKKRINREESELFDDFKDENLHRKQDQAPSDKVVKALRSDMVPGSWAIPAKKNIFQRININFLLGVLLIALIIGLIWYFVSGPGSPILQGKLASLVTREVTPTQTVTPTRIPSATITPLPTYTPITTPTLRPTKTPVIGMATSTKAIEETPTPTTGSGCRDALTITLADVGKALCVKGVVIRTVERPAVFTIAFSNEPGAFYWATYDLVWSKGELDTCYQIQGTISQIGISPLIVFGYSNLPEECP
jgi:hypothetical protein